MMGGNRQISVSQYLFADTCFLMLQCTLLPKKNYPSSGKAACCIIVAISAFQSISIPRTETEAQSMGSAEDS